MTEQITQWILIGVLIAFQAFEKAKKLFKNSSNNPGNHGERIASLETDMKNVKEDIAEIKKLLMK